MEPDACLADGLSVCSGYADAFYVLCRHEGIYCVTDAGYSPEQDPANPAESHVWNLLQTDNGPIYVDLTWYDSREPDIYNSYRDGWSGYLMMTEEGKQMAKVRLSRMVEFLRGYFDENDVPEWNEYLENYLKQEK